jgi:hypothetical protein
LVAVLDWGLGHATRCVPLIQSLIENNFDVTIGGNGRSLQLLQSEFPHLPVVGLPGYEITYPLSGSFSFTLFTQLPAILKARRKECAIIGNLINQKRFDAVISDNRYGCYHPSVPSVIITHQLSIQPATGLLWLKPLIDRVIENWIGKFTECWIPDDPKIKLSGRLSLSKRVRSRHIGILSRLIATPVADFKYALVGLVSGPEPQRTVFENILISQFRESAKPCLIVRGLPGGALEEQKIGNITLLDHLPANRLQVILAAAPMVIARSGYSTIMDLWTLQKRSVVFIPTPGQTEQEYLARWMKEQGIAPYYDQSAFVIAEALVDSKKYSGFVHMTPTPNLLPDAIHSIMNRLPQ